MRDNGGGYETYVFSLLEDLLSKFCSRELVKRVRKEYMCIHASRINTPSLQYKWFLDLPRKTFKELSIDFNKTYTPDKRTLKDIYRAARASRNL